MEIREVPLLHQAASIKMHNIKLLQLVQTFYCLFIHLIIIIQLVYRNLCGGQLSNEDMEFVPLSEKGQSLSLLLSCSIAYYHGSAS